MADTSTDGDFGYLLDNKDTVINRLHDGDVLPSLSLFFLFPFPPLALPPLCNQSVN
jgi:hypothetical protein